MLYGDTRLTSRLLRDLTHHGLLAARPSGSAPGMDAAEHYRYDPANGALAEAVSQLRQAYDQQPFTVIRAMFTKRAPVARSLADAFRIRRPKDDDPSGNG